VDFTAPSSTTVVASGRSWLGVVAATSTGNPGPSACGATPTTEDATSTGGGSARSDVDGGATSAVACSATTEGAGATAGGAGTANEAATSAPLQHETGATLGNGVCLA